MMKTHVLTPILYEVLSVFYSKDLYLVVFLEFFTSLSQSRSSVRVELCNLITLLIVGRHFFISSFLLFKVFSGLLFVKILLTAKSKFCVVYDLYLAASKTKSFFLCPSAVTLLEQLNLDSVY